MASAIALVAAFWSGSATAERSTFETYGFAQGLSSLDGSSLAQDRAGDILVPTNHGVFAYDGRRFVNLGTDQGLPQGGRVFSIALTAEGRVAVQYPGEVYVSDAPSTTSRPVTSLSFQPLVHPGVPFYEARRHGLAAWGAGFVVLAGDATLRVVVPPGGQARTGSMPYDPVEQSSLKGARSLFSIGGHLWETFEDGRVCAADPGAVRCYGAVDGLAQGLWFDMVGGDGGRVLARSASAVATFDPASRRWSSSALPDQGGRYDAYDTVLGLYRTPDGTLITQSVQGIDVLGPTGWRELTVADGAPSGIIVSAMTDGAGELWFHVLGRGLVRWVGYGQWNTLEESDGLSNGLPWETARSTDGRLWVSTDNGVDEVARQGTSRHVLRVFPGSSYALAATARGDIWAGYLDRGVQVIDPATGSMAAIPMPPVETIVPVGRHVIWIGTAGGLYTVDDSAGPPFHPVLVRTLQKPISIWPDGQDGLYYIGGDRLQHLHRDGADVAVAGTWKAASFEPRAIVADPNGDLWVGGPGGLFRLTVVADRVRSIEEIPTEDLRSNTVTALMIDHRGWIWVGTEQGVSVYDGHRWVSTDSGQGLLSNDTNENGIREDPNGSVWITTSRGVSHLRDPASLFADRPLTAVITRADIGTRPVEAGQVPYSHDPLLVEFGTPNYGIGRPVLFRYRLSDVDDGWVSSSSGIARYASVAPGRHVLTVVATDILTHRQSPETRLVVEVGFPWWRQWWAEGLWTLCTIGVCYGGMRLRYRALYARQTELRRHVAEATAQIRHQAAHDQLTGLLVRAEVERRLAKRLQGEPLREELVIALLDVDHFKRINDHRGHLGGDEVLRTLGSIVARTLRDGEFAGRYGGEEILVVLADIDGLAAERVLDLHLAVRHGTFEARSKPVHVTCSIGLAWARHGDNWETLIGRADDALYQAKNAGRDRVVESRVHDALANGPVETVPKSASTGPPV